MYDAGLWILDAGYSMINSIPRAMVLGPNTFTLFIDHCSLITDHRLHQLTDPVQTCLQKVWFQAKTDT